MTSPPGPPKPNHTVKHGNHILFLLGPAIFIVVGVGFLVASAMAPPGSLTDDGYPLDTFFLIMGAVFGGIGPVWLVGALLGFRWSARKRAELDARREHLRRHGVRLLARVVSCESDGYMNFDNELWTDLVLEYDAPGAGRRRVSRRTALARPLLERGRAGGPFAILIDPRAPDDYLLA